MNDYCRVGKTDVLYLTIPAGAYENIRAEERRLNLQSLPPVAAIKKIDHLFWALSFR
ncbi:MAG: hypothetical protein J2P54_20930 [Bradyrhizobiaceae bacterium]|nr:hypothetical protein [Bradyrhizobiaceae bacterium]